MLDSKSPSLKFVRALVEASWEEDPIVGDLVETDDGKEASVIEIVENGFRLGLSDAVETFVCEDDYLYILDRQSIRNIWEEHQKNEMPDGVSYSGWH